MSGFPWERVLELGFRHLRLGPREVWSMTLRELVAALGPRSEPMTRGDLERLMADYPDRPKEDDDAR